VQNSGDLLEKYIDAFKTEDEAVLDDLKRKFYYNTPMFDTKEINPYELARREGNREVLLYILDKIQKGYERRATRSADNRRKRV
jgi:hypothetical protein